MISMNVWTNQSQFWELHQFEDDFLLTPLKPHENCKHRTIKYGHPVHHMFITIVLFFVCISLFILLYCAETYYYDDTIQIHIYAIVWEKFTVGYSHVKIAHGKIFSSLKVSDKNVSQQIIFKVKLWFRCSCMIVYNYEQL